MDELAQSVLAGLKKPSATLDSKLQLFNSLKTAIKHQRIPDSAQAPTLECVRLAITSQTSSALVTVGFSTLGHLTKRLLLQEQAHNVFNNRTQIIPALLDRLGDNKESYRSAAVQALCDLWPARSADVEKAIKENALLGSNVRARECAMTWVTRMHAEQNLQFKSFVPPLVECLDHSDGTIRDAAKNSLVELFRNANDRAKADLKRQLTSHNVRKSIASYILSHLEMPVPAELATSVPAPSHTHSAAPAAVESSAAEAIPHDHVMPPSAETTNIEPLYVDSQRYLEDLFRDMTPHFEGRESEQNWMPRDSSVLKIRKLLKGNAPSEYLLAFVACIKQMLDGILKVFNSLRTTMSSNGTSLVQEMARRLGPAIDSMVEILMQNAIKLCSATKHIAAQNGNATVEAILGSVTCNTRLVQHVWFAAQDKNVQPRTFAAGWLQILMKRQAGNKANFEHSGGLELAEKIIKKGLSDATPKVRETMRGTFWVFHATWPDRAELIMDGLDAKSKGLLEKDPGNPNASSASFTSSVGHGAGGAGNVRAVASRTSLKEQIAAQKRANLAAKKVPSRPNSAMANLSPAKPAAPTRPGTTVGGNSTRSTPGTSRPGTSSTGQGSLMAGPVRRPKKPEVPRPATADPYASVNRRLARTDAHTPSHSPRESPLRGGPSHMKAKSGSALRPGTSDSDKSGITTSPRISPSKTRPKTIHGGDSTILRSPGQIRAVPGTPDRAPDEHETRPGDVHHHDRSPQGLRHQKESGRVEPNHSSPPLNEEDENFTLVMPQKVGLSSSHGPASSGEAPERPRPTSQSTSRTPQSRPASSHAQASVKKVAPEATPASVPVVFEDPSTSQPPVPAVEQSPKVLEELTINGHHTTENTHSESADRARTPLQEGMESPMKSIANRSTPGPAQERTDAIKHRRLLSSGVERLRARTLDAHGFRRLQELVRGGPAGGEAGAQQHTGLIPALAEYVEAAPESLKVSGSKAASLKSQALATLRTLLAQRRDDEDAQRQCGRVLCALLRARQQTERASPLHGELDRTGQEAVRCSGQHAGESVDSVADHTVGLSVTSGGGGDGEGASRAAVAAFAMLGQLLGAPAKRRTGGMAATVGGERLGRLAGLAVTFLGDGHADVRRAATEFCLVLHGSFADEERVGDFWAQLQAAPETQLNMVAYYVARRGGGGEQAVAAAAAS